MMPFIDIFGRSFSTYALFGILGMFVAALLVYLRGRKHGLIFMDVLLGVVVLGAGLVVGGVVLYAITQAGNAWSNRELFSANPVQFLQHLFGGMVFYGGLFGVVAALPIYARIIKRDVLSILGLLVPTLPLAHAIMRIGCFMAGCCHGVAHNTLGMVFYASPIAPNYAVIPTQLIEVVANILIFAFLWTHSKVERPPLRLLGLYGIMYAIMRFCLEFFRGDDARGFIFGLSTSQFISIGVLIVGIILVWKNRKSFA